MVILLSLSTGILIIILSLVLIRKEFIRASKLRNSNFSNLSDKNVKEVLSYLDSIETTIEEMNESYYEISNDLEGKYSVHEKEIEIIDQKVNDINLLSKELAKLLKFQGKELAAIKVSEEINKKNNTKIDLTETIKETPKPKIELVADDNKFDKKLKSLDHAIDEYTYTTSKKNENEDLKEEILRLKALGMDDNQIARTLSKGVREIKMLLSFIK